jgi:hypothetical protein
MGNNLSSKLKMIKGSNITNIKNFGAVFKDTLDIEFVREKETNLEKLRHKIEIPKVEKVINTQLTNQEYLYLTKNFVNLYNENNKKRMSFLKKSFGVKYLLNNKYILYFILFFCEFEDFERNSKAQNIFFLSVSEQGKDLNFEQSVVFTKVIGQWPSSDILFGNEDEFVKTRFINIFKDEPIKFVLDEHIIKKVLEDKLYITNYYYERGFPPKKFKTINPQYINPKKSMKIKINDKCFDVKDGKISFNFCDLTKSKFNILENNKIQYENTNNCIAFHKNREMSLVPCDTINICDSTNNLQSCQIFKNRKFGGLEIVGKNKCLNKNFESIECHKADKVSYIQ